MKHGDLTRSDPRLMAELLTAGGGAEPLWRAEELAAVLKHQLSAPVEFEPHARSRDPHPGHTRTKPGIPVSNFDELFHHPNPPVELLLLTKEFAKASRVQLESLLPQEVATVLYYASIVVARTRLGKRISGLDDKTTRKGIEWVVAQPWVDERTRGIFKEGLTALG
jgi:hypothetical protein